MIQMQLGPALIKRELLEHNTFWKVPLALIAIAILVKLSLSIGNLAIDIKLPSELQLDKTIDDGVTAVVKKSLSSMHFIIMLSMFIVSIFYALACLYDERKDDSVLFWRSLPISDTSTVLSKLAVAVIVVPIVILACQLLVSVIFLGFGGISYVGQYFAQSIPTMSKVVLWAMLPTISWCLFCSEVANKNPFMLAFLAPIVTIAVDKLFLNGIVSETLIINRLTNFSEFAMLPLFIGFVISALFIALAVAKRKQRF